MYITVFFVAKSLKSKSDFCIVSATYSLTNICKVESAAATKLPLVFDGAVPATAKNFFIGSSAVLSYGRVARELEVVEFEN